VSDRGQTASTPSALAEGFELHQSGDLKGALKCYRRVLKKDKNNVEALYLLGSLHSHTGDQRRAEAALRAALDGQPTHADARYNLARVFMDTNRYQEAEEELATVLSARPTHVSALRNMGVVCLQLGKPNDALVYLSRAVEIDPLSAQTWSDFGLARSQLSDDLGSEQAFDQALSLEPELARARHNRGHVRLRNLNFVEGWRDYEARKDDPKSGFEARDFGVPEWQGEGLTGKKILVWGEQGLGDQIFHAGALQNLIGRAGQVVLECEPRLAALFERSFPAIFVVPRADSGESQVVVAGLDLQVSSGSLGRWCRPDVSDVSTASRYLKADSSKAQTLRKKYGTEFGDRPMVGVSWCSHRVGVGPHKSTNLAADWAPIFAALPNAVFVSLQYGKQSDVARDIAAVTKAFPNVTFLQDGDVDATRNIDALAAQVAGLDAVVSVSNTTVHLAGALGIPTWTFVPIGPSRLWYWLDGRKGSPWYSSMTLAWQKEIGSWIEPISETAAALKKRAWK
jgi:Flp pilus assembly protein TadD